MVVISGKSKAIAKRYYANVFDYFIFLALIAIYIFTVGDENLGTYKVTGLKATVIPLTWLIYFPVCETIFGQTIGKRVFNLYVCDFKSRNPSIVHSFLRRITDPFEIVFFGIPSILSINTSDKNQRIGDRIADTTVVNLACICRHCDIKLELTPQEATNETFVCPQCKQVN